MQIIQNTKFGYYEVENKPSQEELNLFYTNKYYQQNHAQYSTVYSADELNYFNLRFQRYHSIISSTIHQKTLLDIGCGEGFALNYFNNNGYQVKGIDFSNAGIQQHNPSLLQGDTCMFGNTYDILNTLCIDKQQFGVILLNNVLEHVIDPIKLLTDIKNIMFDDSILIITVPNDFSTLQQHLIDNNFISSKYWICPPEHLTYFSFDSLIKLTSFHNYNCIFYMSDYPIEFDLLIDNTNYINAKQKNDITIGKQSHLKRIRTELLLNSISIDKTNQYYKSLCDLGLGRQITLFLTK